MDASSADFPSLYFRMQLQQPIFSGTFSSKDPGIYPLVCSFLTTRNGVFYGSLYVTLGLWFSRKQWHMPPLLAAAGSLIFLGVMYKEVSTFSNANMVFSAVPTVVCLVELAMGLKGNSSRFFLFLREQSQWIYFSHYYFIHLFSWTIHYNPLPMTKKNIMLSVLVPMFLFTFFISFLSHRQHGQWLRKLI